MRRPISKRFVLLLVAAVGVLTLCATCGGSSTGGPTATIGKPTRASSSTATPGSIADHRPKVLSRLPEGKLLVSGASIAGSQGYLVIEGDRAKAAVVPVSMAGDDLPSSDRKYVLHWERTASGERTALVILRTDGTEAFRLAVSSWVPNVVWSPAGDRIAYEIAQTVNIRDAETGEQRQFEGAAGANVVAWLADGTELLLVTVSAPAGEDRKAYIMDASTGMISEIILPGGGTIGPGAEFDSFSPDARYISYPVFHDRAAYDLWVMEIATGRTCLLMKDAPSHQYPEGAGWSPDSRWVTYATRYEFSPLGFQGLHAVNTKTCADHAVGPANGGQPSWSPQGQSLAIMIQGAAYDQFGVDIWHPDGALLSTGLKYFPRWSPDGMMVASVTPDGVQVADASTGDTTAYHADTPPFEDTGLLWSPSSRYIVVYGHRAEVPEQQPDKPLGTPHPGAAQMYVVDTQTGNVVTLVDEQREFTPTAWLP